MSAEQAMWSGAVTDGADEAGRTISDMDLLDRVRERDDIALAALYDRYAGMVLTVALRVVGDRQLAEEIVQDTFLRCWNGVETYQRSRGPVAAWLMGIARNRSIDLLRSRFYKTSQRERTSIDDIDRGGGMPDPVDEAEFVLTRHAISAALGGLSLAHRQVLELAYYGGMTQKEIASQIGEPIGTVKSRTRAALEHLRKTLKPHLEYSNASEQDGHR